MNVKDIINDIFYMLQGFVMWFPFWPLRWLWLKIFMKRLGKGTYVARCVTLMRPWNIEIGENCVINHGALLDGRGDSLQIGDCVDVAREAMIWSLTHSLSSPEHKSVRRATEIGDHCWICTRAIVNAGTRVGRGAVVGAGAVVSREVPEKAVMAGNPGKQIGERDNPLTYRPHLYGMFS